MHTKDTPIENFGFPVTLAFSKKGKFYFSERITGRLWEANLNFRNKKQESSQKARLIITLPVVPLVGHNETGLLGIALDPKFESNGFIYCYYTHGTSEKNFKNRVVRVKK
ncbi:MAG TPA: PQQ-dependent sugar dehydrogenase, partial [Candidatus Paceibacterota bacterium]|nr:PQQ-dependent sugar dehydrogenase [Candidatus Paceibacterota bacterium]